MPETLATAKLQALQLLTGLPEDSSFDDIQYHLYVLQKVGQGIADVDAGRTFTGEAARQRLSRWLD